MLRPLLARRVAAAIAVAPVVLLAGALAPRRAEAALPPLIPRDVLFGNPERASPRLSPDGKRLAWLAPDDRNVLQVWVRLGAGGDAKKVTNDSRRGIRQYLWAEDDRTLLYLQDSDGDENFHVLGADLETGAVRDYTPFQGVRAEQVRVSPTVRDRFLVALNLRDRRAMDVHLVDLRTGAVTLDTQSPGDVQAWTATDDLAVRGASASLPDGSSEVRVRGGPGEPWRVIARAPFGEEAELLDLSADGKVALVRTNVASDTVRLVAVDVATGKETVVARSAKVDLGDAVIHPRRHVVEAADFPAARQAWTIVDPAVKPDFDGLRALGKGDFTIVSRDRADRTWVVELVDDRAPARYYAWDREARKASFLFSSRPKLDGFTLAEMRPFTVKARDGLELNGYLTLPVGVPPKALPAVLFPHGGPWARDAWGFSRWAQWYANRGYAVLQVNFRGSTGYGKAFLNAGNREWGRKMHADLLDTVAWAVKQGHVDAKRVAVDGGSYGGYSALASAAFTPDVFRCAVAVVAPSNLFTLLRSVPSWWAPFLAQLHRRVGNPDDPADEPLLRAASPLFSADRIRIPLLLGQGKNDPRVRQAEAEQIVAAIEKSGGRVTYVLYPDEGHGFARPENQIDFDARAEAFLADCLGGRAEPMAGDRVPGSTAVVKVVEARR